MSIGVAIIGSGIFVKEEHLPAVNACPLLSLKAIYSRSLKSAQSLNANTDLYSDDASAGYSYSDLLFRQDIHAVIIALPILTQPEFIEAALAAGKHVLSEKPIAGTISRAEQLIKYYKSDAVQGNATWAVAENFRFLESFEYGKREIERLGRVLGFRVKIFGNVKPGDKYFETPWRKNPSYQGGFVLDGGVHFVAGTRLLLGQAARPVALSAFTTLLQEYLPPVDTVNSIWLTDSGISGTFAISFGTTLSGAEYTVACEKGSITVEGSRVTVREGEEKLGSTKVTKFKDEDNGVTQEVAAWAHSISSGNPDSRQFPEQALIDLEILEKMLTSGAGGGKREKIEY